MIDNELYHHGILGMRWGVRRSPAQLARASSSPVKKPMLKGKVAKTTMSKKSSGEPEKKSVSEMTNEELSAKVRRLELEKRYRDLNPKKVSKGKKFVDGLMDKVIVPATTEAGKQILKDYLIKTSNNAMNKANNASKKK